MKGGGGQTPAPIDLPVSVLFEKPKEESQDSGNGRTKPSAI